MSAQPLFGYLFVARNDMWSEMATTLRVGNVDKWDRVRREEVQVGRPVLIALSEPGNPRLVGTGVIVEAPSGTTAEHADQAWVRYDQIFQPDEFRLPPADPGTYPPYGSWDNGQLDLILGIRPAIPGQQAVPFRVPARTRINVSVGDAQRIRRLFPRLVWVD